MSIGLVPDPGSIQLPQASIVPDPGSIQLPGQVPAPAPSGLEAAGRGLLQGATLGFSDEISGAIQSIFGDKTYEQARDESRAANAAAQSAHPFLYGAGEVGGGIGTAFVPGLAVAKGAGLAKTALSLGAQGAAAGLGGSNASLVGPNQDIAGAVKDTALGGVIGAGVGAIGHGISSLVAKAPEIAMAQRAADVAQGEGTKGSATLTIKKALARDPEGIDQALTNGFTSDAKGGKALALADIMRKPASEIMPVVDERIEKVAQKAKPIYEAANKLEGGLSLSNFVNHIDTEVEQLSKDPTNEKLIETILDAKRTALKAWAPELESKLAANDTASKMGLDSKVFDKLDEVKVPYQDFRKWVTHLQKEGTNGTRTIMDMKAAQAARAKVGTFMRDFMHADMEALAERHPGSIDVEKLLANNREVTALANIQDAVESRFWKENAGNTSGKGHIAQLAGAGVGALAGSAIPIPVVGHAVGAAVGAAAGGKVAAAAGNAARSATSVLASTNAKLLELAKRAAAGDMSAKNVLAAVHNSPEIMARLGALMLHSHGEGG